MEAVRTIVSAERLTPLINLPWNLTNLQVEVIVIPIAKINTQQSDEAVENLEGCLKSYANPSLWEKEQNAWENNIIEKYGNI